MAAAMLPPVEVLATTQDKDICNTIYVELPDDHLPSHDVIWHWATAACYPSGSNVLQFAHKKFDLPFICCSGHVGIVR